MSVMSGYICCWNYNNVCGKLFLETSLWKKVIVGVMFPLQTCETSLENQLRHNRDTSRQNGGFRYSSLNQRLSSQHWWDFWDGI